MFFLTVLILYNWSTSASPKKTFSNVQFWYSFSWKVIKCNNLKSNLHSWYGLNGHWQRGRSKGGQHHTTSFSHKNSFSLFERNMKQPQPITSKKWSKMTNHRHGNLSVSYTLTPFYTTVLVDTTLLILPLGNSDIPWKWD